MATPIQMKLARPVRTPAAPKASYKPVKVTGILHFVENQRGQGVISRHGEGLDGSPGLVVFPNKFNTFEDTGWWLVTYDVGSNFKQAFAYLVTNQGALREAICDLRRQLIATPENAIFVQDEEIVAVAMINFIPNGDGGLVGYYSQGNYGQSGMKVMPAGNTSVSIQKGWNLVVLYENPDDLRTLVAEPVLDDKNLKQAVKDLRSQLDMVQHPKQDEQQS